jgi:crossover junction endodeoxyribonuclease RuvC
VRVLGIDPGSRFTGWGIVDVQGSKIRPVASGVIEAGDGAFVSRMVVIGDELDAIIKKHQPDEAAVEAIFHSKNSQSALKLGHARGVALLSIGRAGIALAEYPPARIKQSVAGHGRASKDQVQQMVRMLLGQTEAYLEDESDALAAALCHVQMVGSPTSRLLADMERGLPRKSKQPRQRRGRQT